jgi:DNA-binding NarL/FixJ family response regulator
MCSFRASRIAFRLQFARGHFPFREREVVQLVGEGRTSKEVAARLGISLKTAETHRSNILMKLNLHSTVELVLYAVQNEMVDVVHLPLVVPRAPHNGNGHAQIAV